MSLAVDDFADFFAVVNGGHAPFRWQRRLLDYLIEHARWPEHISAPTGSGKSNVVDVHVFVNALAGWGVAPRLPRRLAVVVNRRALVDSHHLRAVAIQQLVNGDDVSGVVAEVRAGLLELQAARTWAIGETPPVENVDALVVAELRGGIPPERGWVDDPSGCAVVAATPDMWGSRLLMRGYGSRPQAWPREAGLLAYDSVVVVDEAHLNRQLLLTARRVGELEVVVDERLNVPPLQVVNTTATPDHREPEFSVEVLASDLVPGADEALARRLTRPKPVRISASPAWPGKGRAAKQHIDHLVAEVQALLATRGDDPRPIGCIVNRVDTATRVAVALDSAGVSNANWVGRLRPADVAALRAEHPELFSSSVEGDSGIEVLVATQTVEVGVDLDLAGLVTELASGSALAQRAGRVNRIGRAASGDVVVVGPADPDSIVDYLPYRADDLRRAYTWVEAGSVSPDGFAPWAIDQTPPPSESSRRMLDQRPELFDAHWWSHTAERLFARTNLDLYLRDSLEPESATAGLVLRDFDRVPDADLDPSVLLSLLLVTPPAERETFDVALGTLRDIVRRALDDVPQQVFLVRDGETSVLTDDSLAPGDVVVLPRSFPCLRAGVPVAEPATDTPITTYWGDPGVDLAPDDWRLTLAGMGAEEAQEAYGDNAVQVVLPTDSESADVLAWVVLKPAKVVLDDTEQLQISGLGKRVGLAQHHGNVEQRARDLAAAVGLAPALVDVLAAAGRYHDEGKRDLRFQRSLDADPNDPEPIAKSARRSKQQARRDFAASGLRAGWRHEQLSAAVVAGGQADVADRDLTVRLVGTSHGRGRDTFDHPARELRGGAISPAVAAAAEELFGSSGGWERLIEATHQRWGEWGCAYLEAILRAADCQISREGS